MEARTIAFWRGRRGIPDAAYRRTAALADATGSRLAVVPDPGPRGARPEAMGSLLPPGVFLSARMATPPPPGRVRRRAAGRRWLSALPCSGWVLPSRPGPRTRVVVAAVGLDEPEYLSLDLEVLATAGTLARVEDARLVVVHAWTLIGESIITCPERGLGPLRGRRALRRMQRDREERLVRLLQSAPVAPEAQPLVVKGPVGEALGRTLKRTGADTLVLGYRGRSGLWGALQGNLADSFADAPGLAVLAVRAGHPVVAAKDRPPPSSPAADPTHAGS